MADQLLVEGDDFRELARQLLSQGTALRYRATGGSMGPLVASGAVLEVQPCAARDLRLGEVGLFVADTGHVLAHRLIRRHDDIEQRHAFRGDARRRDDRPVPAARVLGRVVALRDDRGVLDLKKPLFRLLGWMFVLTPLVARRAARGIQIVRSGVARHGEQGEYP